ncbi:hypothetical protein K8353_30200 [Burkholderia contaminans]|nr:hypothetical protein [Burkholderia contaminans]
MSPLLDIRRRRHEIDRACVEAIEYFGVTHSLCVEQGRPVELLADRRGDALPLFAYHPSRHLPPAKVRAFVDFVTEILSACSQRARPPS